MKEIRVVIDTNIFMSGIISPHGIPRKILESVRKKNFVFVTSEKINEEIMEVLHRDYIYKEYGLNEEIIDDISALLYEGSELVEGLYEVVKGVPEDFKDDKFLACALEGKADYLVSGDKHLRNLKYYHDIQIINPQQFIEMLEQTG